MAHKYHQGFFRPKNPHKYRGNVLNIVFRSSYEFTFMSWCDAEPKVIEWASEERCVAYKDPVSGRLRRYFIDFVIKIKNDAGKIEALAIEIKPESQTKPPVQGKNKKRFLREAATYATNLAKWEAATKWAENRGMKFKILTEIELGIPRGK